MYYNLKEYYERRGEHNILFSRIPFTFHVKKAIVKDVAFAQFFKYYNKLSNQKGKKCKNIWIIKPAENTNRGNGIFVSRDMNEIK